MVGRSPDSRTKRPIREKQNAERVQGENSPEIVDNTNANETEEVANGEANKVFIPFEATSTLSSLGTIKEVLKDCLKYVFYHPDKNDKETLMLYIRDVWK